MRHRRAVEKLRELAAACEWTKRWPPEEPFLHEVYVFGDVLEVVDPLESVQVALAINLPPEEVPWLSEPPGTAWLATELRLNKGGFTYWWRSRHEPVANHVIRNPVRFWSLEGTDEAVLAAIREHRFAELPRQQPVGGKARRLPQAELERALAHLRSIREHYWDRDWRREHRGGGRYPEDHLFEAVDGYLDLLDAGQTTDPEVSD